MRSNREIKDRLRQVKYRALQKLLRQGLKEAPSNCGHNEVFDLGGGSILGLCGIPEETGQKVCDARVPGCMAQAKECPWFSLLQSKEEIKSSWEGDLQGDRGQLALSGYMDIVVLEWVLDDPGSTYVAPAPNTPPTPDPDLEPDEQGQEEAPALPNEGEDSGKKSVWTRWFGG